MITAEQKEQTVEILQSLVRVKSLSGEEQQVIDLVTGHMNGLGYEDVRVDECGNVIGVLRGGDGPTVLYDSHVDTVDIGNRDEWRHDPLGAEEDGGRIYGRGTCDMKGALAASLVGLAAAKADGTLKGTALVSASVGEEIIEGLTMRPIIDRYSPDLVVICESTELRVNVAQRGRAEIAIAVHGKSAHASSPQVGINAFRNMAKLALALDEIVPPHDEQLGYGILEPTQAITSPYPGVSVVPWRCDARYDRRLLVGEGEDEVLAPIREVFARLKAADPQFNAEAHIVPGKFTCYTGLTLEQETLAPAWRMANDDPWVLAAQAALVAGDSKNALGHYSFCTNGSYTKGRAGVPTLGYGPGKENTAHITNEYLELSQLFGAVEGYHALAAITL